MRPVVHGQRDLLAFALIEERREFENISDRGSPKSVQALVVVTHDAKIFLLTSKKQQYAFLNGIRVLILVHHEV